MKRITAVIAVLVACLLNSCAITAERDAAARAALAPTGSVRVGFVGASIYAVRDAASGEVKGVAADIGQDLARRIGVPFTPVLLPNPSAVLAAAKAGEIDVALMGISAERAAVVDFGGAYMEVEQSVLLRPGLAAATLNDIDRSGWRVGVLEKAAADLVLSQRLRQTEIVRVPNAGDLAALFAQGKIDMIAATKSTLYGLAAKHPGARVLDDRLVVEPIGMGVPKGRSAGLVFVERYLEEAKRDGTVKSAIERAGLRGVVVAPPK